jgi:hypothetical protein
VLFKKKIPVPDYLTAKLDPLFSEDREATWERLRATCNDAALNQAEKQTYYDNLRAVMIELMSIAVTKNCSMDASIAASVFIGNYLKRRTSEIGSLRSGYNQAFGSSAQDGVVPMVNLFAERVTHSAMSEPTKRQFYTEFYALLRVMFDEFTSIKLTTSP